MSGVGLRHKRPLHWDMEDETFPPLARQIAFNKPATIAKPGKEDAA
jgi:hypothetical protein